MTIENYLARRDLAFGQGECLFGLAWDVLHIEGLDQ